MRKQSGFSVFQGYFLDTPCTALHAPYTDIASYLTEISCKDYFFTFFIMVNAQLVKSMLDNACHIGHKREYWSPKMRDYIFGIQNGIHVFDLYKTSELLTEMKAVLEDLTSKGKQVLFVGTKIQSRDLVEALASGTGHFYVNTKWTPGLITNFATIKKRIAYYNELEKELEGGLLEGLTKKEKSVKLKELEKLKSAYSGVKDLKKIPDIIFVVDGHYEDLALSEAQAGKVTTMALLGSTGNIDKTDYFVPCNVNSMKSLAFILGEIKSSIKTRKTEERKPVTGSAPRTEKLPMKKGAMAETEEVAVEA